MGAGKMIMEIAMWTVVAAILVFVIMNAPKVAVAVTSIGNWVSTEQGIYMGGVA
jgi:uncharacterized MnhB-related membrane protein